MTGQESPTSANKGYAAGSAHFGPMPLLCRLGLHAWSGVRGALIHGKWVTVYRCERCGSQPAVDRG